MAKVLRKIGNTNTPEEEMLKPGYRSGRELIRDVYGMYIGYIG
jgi:hypothetical protein